MKKILVILVFSFFILSKTSAGDLKNPGDIMVDFESFSLKKIYLKYLKFID